MKHILVLCSLFFITILAYAKTCPQPPTGFIFRVAAWGNHVDSTSQVRCHYYNSNNVHREIWTSESYTAEDFISYPQWHSLDSHYYLCSGYVTNINDCPFGR